MSCFIVISGCSGGGKSALLAELSTRGYAVVEEPGRRIVREEVERGGAALPWLDAAGFARRAVALSLDDLAAASRLAGPVFFDRGLVDAVAALRSLPAVAQPDEPGATRHYHRRVFLAPPWPEIYVNDRERRHGYDAAVAEYDRLAQVYPSLGYEVVILPKVTVEARADFVLAGIEE